MHGQEYLGDTTEKPNGQDRYLFICTACGLTLSENNQTMTRSSNSQTRSLCSPEQNQDGQSRHLDISADRESLGA